MCQFRKCLLNSDLSSLLRIQMGHNAMSSYFYDIVGKCYFNAAADALKAFSKCFGNVS